MRAVTGIWMTGMMPADVADEDEDEQRQQERQ